MLTISTTEAREDLSTLVNEVAHGKQRVILRRRGKQVAALIPMEDFHLLQKLEDELEDRVDAFDAETVLDTLEGGELHSWKDVKKRLGL